jgi:hypothetical protein
LVVLDTLPPLPNEMVFNKDAETVKNFSSTVNYSGETGHLKTGVFDDSIIFNFFLVQSFQLQDKNAFI